MQKLGLGIYISQNKKEPSLVNLGSNSSAEVPFENQQPRAESSGSISSVYSLQCCTVKRSGKSIHPINHSFIHSCILTDDPSTELLLLFSSAWLFIISLIHSWNSFNHSFIHSFMLTDDLSHGLVPLYPSVRPLIHS